MPPPKKPGKAIEEDFSDVPTLPELNSLIFSMILEFKNKDRKAEVLTKLKDTWKDKVKVITRDDIIDYGRKKLTIEDDEDIKNVTKMAKAASEKLFEQFVQARREKKERHDKLYEEAKTKVTEDNPDPKPNIDPNAIDCFFHMPDFPKTYEEAAALNKFQYALNAMIHIVERPAIIEKKIGPELDKNGHAIEGTEQVIMEEEQVPEASRVSDQDNQALKSILEGIQKAVKDSAKNTAIRNFVVVNKEFNYKPPEPVQAEPAQPPPADGAPKPVGIEVDVFNSLNSLASDLIKYKNFKLKSNLIKLKATKPGDEIESKLEEGTKPVEVEKEAEVSKEPNKLDKSKQPDASQIDKTHQEIAPPPVLESTLAREWNYESYHKVVNELPADKRSIAGLLAACVLNVCDELEKEQNIIDKEKVEQDEDDEFKYIFDEVLDHVNSSTGFAERQILSASESVFSKSAARSMFSSGQRSRDRWNQDIVIDMQDVCSYANDYIMANGDNLSTFEKSIFSYLRTPGIERCEMPSVSEKSKLKREAESPEIYPFATVPVEELERAMMLKALEDQFRSKEPDFTWDFLDRSIEEKYNRRSLVQELSHLLLWEPDTILKYYSRDDSLLLGIYQKLPVDKSYNKQWKAQYKSMPDFSNWLEHFNKDSDSLMPLYDIDDNKVGHIREFSQNLTPSNGGLMRIKKQFIGKDELSQVVCFKDYIIFGIH